MAMKLTTILLLATLILGVGCTPVIQIRELTHGRYLIDAEVRAAFFGLVPYADLDSAISNKAQMLCPGYEVWGKRTRMGTDFWTWKTFEDWTIQCPEK